VSRSVAFRIVLQALHMRFVVFLRPIFALSLVSSLVYLLIILPVCVPYR